MATFVAYQQVNVPHLTELGHRADTGAGNFNSKSSTGLTFTQGETSATSVKVDFVMTGSGFKYVFGYPYAGTITGMNVDVDNVLSYAFGNFQVSISQMFAYWRAGDPVSLFTQQFSGPDQFLGSNFNDVLSGFGGNDHINARGGHDRVLGATGNDVLLGGAGNDVMIGGGGKDKLDGGFGFDTLDYSDKSVPVVVFLKGATFANVQLGAVIEDRAKNIENVKGGSRSDTLVGDANGNRLEGNGGIDTLFGAGAGDVLMGGIGADHLHGGDGNDLLIGGPGFDRFYLETALDAALNLDTFADFVPGVDKIVLNDLIFTVLTAGALDPAAFVNGPLALTSDQHVIYDTVSMLGVGRLFYDPDGLLGVDQVEVARLSGAPALSDTDIIVA